MTEQKIKPATDEEMADYMTGREIAIFRREQDGYMHCVECDASPVGGMRSGHRSQCGNREWPKINARINADREAIVGACKTIERLKVANTKLCEKIAALEAENRDFRTWGVIEVAIRNPNVSSFVAEKEARIAQMEALNAEMLAMLTRGIANAEAPHSTSCPAQDRICLCWVKEARAIIDKAEKQ